MATSFTPTESMLIAAAKTLGHVCECSHVVVEHKFPDDSGQRGCKVCDCEDYQRKVVEVVH